MESHALQWKEVTLRVVAAGRRVQTSSSGMIHLLLPLLQLLLLLLLPLLLLLLPLLLQERILQVLLLQVCLPLLRAEMLRGRMAHDQLVIHRLLSLPCEGLVRLSPRSTPHAMVGCCLRFCNRCCRLSGPSGVVVMHRRCAAVNEA